jgi:hypothetical protein
VSFLRCPDCRLTVAEGPYYFLRGDRCPRCRTTMEPCTRSTDDARPQLSDEPVPDGVTPAAPPLDH